MSARRIVVTSGKGGVGKTTTTANFGAALAMRGKRVVLVDADIGLRNLDLVLGLEKRIVFDLVEVVEGRCQLRQALIKDKRFGEALVDPAGRADARQDGGDREPVRQSDRRSGGDVRLRDHRLSGRDRARVPQRRRRRARSDRRDDARSQRDSRRRPRDRETQRTRLADSPGDQPHPARNGAFGRHAVGRRRVRDPLGRTARHRARRRGRHRHDQPRRTDRAARRFALWPRSTRRSRAGSKARSFRSPRSTRRVS